MRTVFATLLLILSCLPVPGQAGTLPVDRAIHGLGRYAEVLVEQGDRLSPQAARAAFERGEGRPGRDVILNFGIGCRPLWLRLVIDNPEAATQGRLLVVENPWLDRLDAWFLRDGRQLHRWRLGDSLPFSSRPVSHRHFILPLRLEPGRSELLIRVETPDPMILPMFFGTLTQYERHDRFNSYTYGALYGFLLALALYNLVLYARIRLRRYLYYVAFLASFLVMNTVYTGHFFWWFWPAGQSWWQWSNPVTIGLYATAWMAFATAFLQLRRYRPGLFRVIAALVSLFWAVQLVLFLFDMPALAVSGAILFSILVTASILPLALVGWRSGMREAVYLIAATVATVIGTVVSAGEAINWFPYGPISFHAVELGISIDAILLSFGLAQQYRRTQQRLLLAQQVARLDPLTGLYNRRAFEEVIAPLLARAERYRQPLSLMLIDLDNFKRINDRFGHHVGDAVLRAVADAMHGTVRRGDVISRWGGEEFIVLLPDTDRTQAMALAERLRQAIGSARTDAAVAGGNARVTASIGLHTHAGPRQSLEELARQADADLYQAKRSRRNTVVATDSSAS